MRHPLHLVVLLAWMGLIVYWSNQPNLPIDQPSVADAAHNLQHRVAHVLAYGLMGLLAWWTFAGRPRAWLIAIVVTSVFGMTDEFHQSFIPGRRAAVDDWLVDTFSAAVAIFLVAQLRKTPLRAPIQMLAPLVVAVAFAVGVALAVRPALSSAVALLHFGGS
jgi:VanZ family protein